MPPVCSQALSRVATCHDALRAAIEARLPKPLDKTASGRAADQRLDSVYSGMYDWCRGLSKLPEDLAPGVAAKAVRVVETMFPDGLKFTQIVYKLEWAESQARVDAIDKKNLLALFTELGGDVFVAALRKAHEDYGEALGITKTKPEPAEPIDIRAPLDAFMEALRRYVVQVVAHADTTDVADSDSDSDSTSADSTDTDVDKLLLPLAQWHVPRAGVVTSGAVSEQDEEPASAAPPADNPAPIV